MVERAKRERRRAGDRLSEIGRAQRYAEMERKRKRKREQSSSEIE